MGEISAAFEKHPWVIFVAIALVALIAYLQSRNFTPVDSSQGVSFTGGGVIAPPYDSNAAAVDQARVAAGSANLSTLSQLVLGYHATDAQSELGDRQTNAALTAHLADTNAALTSSLATTAASQEISDRQTDASVTITGLQTSATKEAAQLTASTQALIAKFNADAAAVAESNRHSEQLFQTQSQKDAARAADNTTIVDGIVHVGEQLLAIFGF